MSAELQALLFDVDGTLAETEELHRKAFNQAFALHDLDWHWDFELYHELLLVTGGKERIKYHVEREGLPLEAFPDERIAAIHQTKNSYYKEGLLAGFVTLRPGINELLKEAHVAGVRMAITTTTSRVNIDRLLEVTLGPVGLSYFEVYVTGDRVKRKKPDGEVYLKALSELNLQASDCLALEDSRQGLGSALEAGIKTVITESAYSEGDEFPGALQVVTLDDPRPCLSDLQGWFSQN